MEQPKKSKSKFTYDALFEKLAKEDSFKNLERNKKEQNLILNNAFNTEQHQVDFDSSNQDYLKGDENPYLNQFADMSKEDPYNEIRADNQSGWSHLGIGATRTLAKATTEVLKLPGVIGGIAMSPFAAENEGFETAFNNQWIKFFDGLNEDVKEALPVYVKESVKNGDFFTKIGSSAFYATEGADGAGFMLGALAPGALFKMFGGANALFGASIKAAKLAKYGEGMEAGRKAMQAAGITIKNIDQYMIPAFNTLSEAGAESKGAWDGMESRKGEAHDEYMSKLNPNDPRYQSAISLKNEELDQLRRSGEISIEEYNQQSANVGNIVAEEMFEKDFKEQKALAAQNSFFKNVVLLAPGNYIQAKILFGKTPSKVLLDKIGGLTEKSVKNTVKQGVKNFAEGFASESFQEVGQTGIEHRNIEEGLKFKLGDNRMDDYNPLTFGEDFIKTLGTTEGQIAGFLGGIMGSPISVVSGYKQDLADRKQTERLRDKINGESTAYKDVVGTNIYEQEEYTNPETGEVSTRDKEVDGKKVFIPEAVAKVKNALDLNEKQGKAYDKAIEEGDTETIEYLKGQAEFNLISKFIGEDEVTLDALHEYLKVAFPTQKSENVSEEQVKSNKENSQRVEKIMNKAKSLQKDLMSYKDMAASLIRINNPEVTEEHLADFMNRVGSTFISERAEEFDAKDKLAKLEKQRADLLSNSTVIEIDNPNYIEGISSELDKTTKTRSNNPRLNLINSQIEKVKEQLKDFEETTNSTIWDNEWLNNKISNEVKAKNKLQKATSPEEVAKNDAELAAIAKAKTEEELEQVYIKEGEIGIINDIKKRISEDSSLENLQNVLEIVKNSNFTNFVTNNLVKSIEDAIQKITDDRSQFEEIVFEIAEKYSVKNKQLVDKLTEIENRISKLIESKESLKKSLSEATGKSKNKLLRKLVKETQSEIDKVDSEIKKLESEKTKLLQDLESIDKNLDYLYNRLEQINKVGFTSIDDIVKYLDKNKDRFGEHRFDIARLSTQQFYTNQNIENIENLIDYLEEYKVVLEQTIKDYLAADEEHSQDLYYLQRELEDSIDELAKLKKELPQEKAKLLRLNKSLNNKLAKQSLDEEIKFWNKLQKYKESKKPNPIIQQKAEAKKAELKVAKEVKESGVINNAKEDDNAFNGTSKTQTYSTEGSDIYDELTPKTSENTTKEEDDEGNKPDATNGWGTKLISYNRKDNEVFSWIKEQFPKGLAFERNPINKIGHEVGFEINQTPGVKLAETALNLFKAGNFKYINILTNYLPINIKLAENAYLPIETRRVTGEVNPETKILRNFLITNLIKNKVPIENMNSTITGQYKGVLQVESLTAENSLLDLSGVDGLKYIKENTYFVNIHGQLENVLTGQTRAFQAKFTKDLNRTKNYAAGEIYLMVPQADGVSQFPLKLNISKLDGNKSYTLASIYSYLLKVEGSSNMTLSEIKDEELLKLINEHLNKELEVIAPTNKTRDIKLGEIIDLLVHESDKPKSRINITNGVLYFGDKQATKENIDDLLMEVAYFLNQSKRHQIKIRPKTAEDNQRTNLSSNSANYIKYLVEGKILSTNAVVNEPLFQGYTNLFISPTVTIKGSEKINDNLFNTVKKYSLTDRNNKPPLISLNDIDLNKSGLSEDDNGFPAEVNKVQLLEIRGVNNEGFTVGTVIIEGGSVKDDTYFKEKYEVFFKPQEKSTTKVKEYTETEIEDRLKGVRTIKELAEGFKTLSKEQQDLYKPLFTEKRIQIEDKGKVKVSDAGAETDSKNWEGLDFGDSKKVDNKAEISDNGIKINNTEFNNLFEDGTSINIEVDKNANLSNYLKSIKVIPLKQYLTEKVNINPIQLTIVNRANFEKINENTIIVTTSLELKSNSSTITPVKITLSGDKVKLFLDKVTEANVARDNYKKLGFKDINEAMRGVDASISVAAKKLNQIVKDSLDKLLKNNQENTRNVQENFLSLPESKTVIEDLSDSNKFVSSSDIPNTVENKQQVEKQNDVFEAAKGKQKQFHLSDMKSLLNREESQLTDKQKQDLENYKKAYPDEYKKHCK